METAEMPVVNDARDIIHRFYQDMFTGKPEIGGESVIGKDFITEKISGQENGIKVFRKFFSSVSEAFPDYKLEIESLVANRDRIMVRYIIRGTQKGIFMGIEPTHQRMTISGIDVFRLDSGKIVEHWDAGLQINGSRERPGSFVT